MLVQLSDLKSMAVYGKTPILKKITLMFMATRLDHNSCDEIHQKFLAMDRDQNGMISQEEFNQIFSEATGGAQVPIRSTNMLFEMLDTNKDH